jgi:hypothetical protein
MIERNIMANKTNQAQPAPDLPRKRSPDLEALNTLVGTWTTAFTHVALPDTVHGQKTFEWLEGNHFLIERSRMEHPEVPDSIGIIGADDSGEGLAAHYFDSRGVARIYQMSLKDGIWKTWRDAPGFSQRFTGTFSDDDKTIKVVGELSRDGVTWEHDFEQLYTKDVANKGVH